MPIQTFENELPVSAEALYAWHTRPGAFQRLSPPWQTVELERAAPVEEGSRARIRMKKGPLSFRWIAEHRDVEPDRGFTDVQVRGPFARWVHRHEFEPTEAGALLRDRIDYELPGGPVGHLLAGRAIAGDIESTFAYRHHTTTRDLERHAARAERPRLTVAITGASGLLGSSLRPFLTTGGHRVVRLVRRTPSQPDAAAWSPQEGLLAPQLLPPVDAFVHLAGENVATGRWTPARKARIRSSRVEGTRNLVRSLAELDKPPHTLVSASAIGFYGSRGEAELDESSDGGEGFLAETGREWETAALEAEKLGIRVVLLRFGVILTPAGGALAKLLPPFRLGGGGRIGDGRQFMSWVSIDDAIGAILEALQNETLSGPVNVTAPEPVTNRQFTRSLGRVLGRPTLLPLPAFAARTLFGEMADEMLLSSARVLPRELEGAGFSFHDPDLDRTLARLLGRVAIR